MKDSGEMIVPIIHGRRKKMTKCQKPVTNSQFPMNNKNVGLYFSSADDFSRNCQVHFAQAAEWDRLLAAVYLFVTGLQE
jgi:hypothetical protein